MLNSVLFFFIIYDDDDDDVDRTGFHRVDSFNHQIWPSLDDDSEYRPSTETLDGLLFTLTSTMESIFGNGNLFI